MRARIDRLEQLVPKDKIKGYRFGQLVWNAVSALTFDGSDQDVSDKLFQIENEELEKAVIDWLKNESNH